MLAAKKLTINVIISLILGIIIGVAFNYLITHYPTAGMSHFLERYFVKGLFTIIGTIFISLLKVLVVPIVFTSMVCGIFQLRESHKVGVMALKTIALYLITTSIAIILAITFASLFKVGSHDQVLSTTANFTNSRALSIPETIIGFFPSNIIETMTKNDQVIQVIVFAILFGSAMITAGNAGARIADFFENLNQVIMKLVLIIMLFAPVGVFCLLAQKFAEMGFDLIYSLIGYFGIVLLVLIIQFTLVYSLLLKFLARLNPIPLYKKMLPVQIFAFSTSSSNATMPVTLEVVEERLGVKNALAAFIIPLGATINMDGTAIMQGVATVFISHFYQIPIGIMGYITVIIMATIASIGTAGVPGIGLITLSMVLTQVGLPVEGIALIIGIDRLLDMLRTVVNVTGDSVVATIVAKSQNSLLLEKYNNE